MSVLKRLLAVLLCLVLCCSLLPAASAEDELAPQDTQSYALYFNANEGQGSMAPLTVKYGASFKLTANSFTRAGFTFAGWNVRRDGDGKWFVNNAGWLTEAQIKAGAYTKAVYPDKAERLFDISWTNGYNGVSTYTFYATWVEGGVTEPSTLKLTGEQFPTGHYDTMPYFLLKGTFESNYIITKVEAHVSNEGGKELMTYGVTWSATRYDVHDNGLDDSFRFGSLADGIYTFYICVTDYSGTKIERSTAFEIGKKTVLTYTVSYDANGGTGAPAEQTKTHDVDLTLSSTVPKREGYEFLGWAKSKSATAPDFEPGAVYKENASLTLYAVWKAAEAGASVTGSKPTVQPGETATVELSLNDNPGVAYLKLQLSFDKAKLPMTKAENKGLLEGSFTASPSLDTQPYVLQWINADNSTKSGVIAVLSFAIPADAEEGEYSIQIAVAEAFNSAREAVKIAGGSATVKVEVKKDDPAGDCNGDGVIDGRDAIVLAQYLANWEVTASATGLDCNADGTVDGRDAILLAQYLANWDVHLGK